MAKINFGTGAYLSGNLGPVVLCHWKGKPYLRKRPNYNPDNLSPAQKAQLAKFGLAGTFVNSIKELAKQSFFDSRGDLNPYNRAQSYTARNAVAGEYPDFFLTHEMIYVSYGNLPGANNPEVATTDEGLHFRWTNDRHPGMAKANDLVIVVAHNEITRASYFLVGPATRSMQEASLPVPGEKGEALHTWLGFINAAGTDASRSIYTGKIKI